MLAKLLFWFTRVLAIVFALFLGLFALDSFNGDRPFLENLFGFFLHLMPTIIIITITIISWRKYIIGSIFFVLTGIIFTFYFHTYRELSYFFLISFPMFLLGILFYLNKYIRVKV